MTTYRVQKVTQGLHEFLTAPDTLEAAVAHLDMLMHNMISNDWKRIDNRSTRGLPVVMLVLDLRTVTLSVVECGETGKALDLRDYQFLVRTVEPVLASEETQDYTVDPDLTPTEGLFSDELVSELANVRQESAGVG